MLMIACTMAPSYEGSVSTGPGMPAWDRSPLATQESRHAAPMSRSSLAESRAPDFAGVASYPRRLRLNIS